MFTKSEVHELVTDAQRLGTPQQQRFRERVRQLVRRLMFSIDHMPAAAAKVLEELHTVTTGEN